MLLGDAKIVLFEDALRPVALYRAVSQRQRKEKNMPEPRTWCFGAFRLDLADERLWRGEHPIRLTYKAFAVLKCLVARPGELVTKDEFFATVWPETVVSESVLTGCIRELRRALGDRARTPQFIDTVYRRGYRFIAPVVEAEPTAATAVPESDVPPRPAASPSVSQSEPGRRQLTVVGCGLVDFTALSSQFDPEEFRDIVQAYQQVCRDVIEQFNGYTAHLIGDTLVAYFGYPVAREDDAHQAVRAGLEIREAITRLNTSLEGDYGIHLAIRIGLHTGVVVMGDMGMGSHQERLALGITPNITACIQDFAQPNAVLLSQTTYRLVEGYFSCSPLGPQTFEGIPEPIPVYQVGRQSQAQSRLEAAGARGLSPFVGRELEAGLLADRWAQAKVGQGQVLLLSGEAGIGKSRLLYAFKDQCGDDVYTHLEYRCLPYYQNTAFYPVTEWFQYLCDWRPDDDEAQKLAKLTDMLQQYQLPVIEAVPLLATILSLPLPSDRYPPVGLTPPPQRHQLFVTLLTLIQQMAERQPVLLSIEDLHWVDPSTLEFLNLLIDQAPTLQILIVGTGRPVFQPHWWHRSYCGQVTLSRLLTEHVEQMLDHLTYGNELSSMVRDQIVEKTDGVPLFVEEMTKTILEAGCHQSIATLAVRDVPSTLRDSLMARLDRLGWGKEVAQLGATIGRQFSYDLLRAVSPLGETALGETLDHLVEAELLYQRGLPPHVTYVFKHALVQETAYESLLKRTRQQYHAQIAQVLEIDFPETKATQPELLAYHYSEARCPEQSIAYWELAGQHAIQRSANVEAISHLSQGVEQLAMLADMSAYLQTALSLHLNLAISLIAVKGQAAPKVRNAYARAHELCDQIEDAPKFLPVLWGLFRYYFARGVLKTARALIEQIMRIAQQASDTALLLEAHRGLGATLFNLGVFRSADEHLAQGLALYDPQLHRSHRFLYGQDPRVVCQAYASWTRLILGYPDQALAQYCGQNLGRLFGNNTIVAKGFVLRAGFFQTQPVS